MSKLVLLNWFSYKLEGLNVNKKPLNYWRVAGVIRREHMMRDEFANLRATEWVHL